ncbi:MAG: hypothetical protein ACOH2V_05090 [Candidatus Saccharimonadaceae bacterium]
MKITIPSILVAFLLCTNCALAQPITYISGIQDSLSQLSSLIWKQKTDSGSMKANDIFFREFQSLLKSASSLNIPFDSIRGITRVGSDDGKMRVFTWNVPQSGETNKYFGFVQFIKDSVVVIPLRSVESDPTDFETRQISSKMWYGAIYYKLIEVKIGSVKAYTLLGWDGYTANSNRKLIDIMYVDNTGNVVFGMPVFKTEQGIKSRIVKEYAEKATMLLRYDYQSILIKKGQKIKKEKTWLIVMDRLIPMDPSMKGMPKYYVSSGEIYDGYIFRDGFWVLVEDIEVTNKVMLKK